MKPAAGGPNYGGPSSESSEVTTYGGMHTLTFEHEVCEKTDEPKLTTSAVAQIEMTSTAPHCPTAEEDGIGGRAQPAVRAPKPRSAGGRTARCHWCSNICSCVLLLAILLVIITYFALHCTPILDELMGEKNVRSWVGVTLPIEIICFVVLPVAVLNNIMVAVRITCCSARTAKSAARIKIEKNKKGMSKQLYSWVKYLRSNRHPYYFW